MRNLSFSYKKKQVLHDVSVHLEAGEVVGLLGPNGSGKSTLTKIAARVLKPQSGTITLDGRDAQQLSRREHARIVGYVPQHTAAPFELTVREAVLLGRTPHFSLRPTHADIAAVERALSLLALDDLSERPLSELSGGQAQRVSIARALAQNSRILLMDEPTSALDLRFQLETLRTMRKLSIEDNTGVLLAIHDLNHAAIYCDRVVVLRGGRVYSSGTPSEALTAETVHEVYGVAVNVRLDDNGFVEVKPHV